MKYTHFGAFATIAVLCTIGAFAPTTADADNNTGTLDVQATVTSSATLTLTDTNGAASTLTFSGTGGQAVTPTEGDITVNAQVTTDADNMNTAITVSATDLTGGDSSNVIPASDLSVTHASDTGGGDWRTGTFSLSSSGPIVMAALPTSGTYSGDQAFSLAIPANANADTYTGTVTYTITGY
jgi:hypothetical protein